MNPRRLVLTSGIALLGTVTASVAGFLWAEESMRVRRYFGPEVWRILQEADQVEVYRLRKPQQEEIGKWAGRQWPAEELRKGPPVTPSREWTERLRSILRRPSSYLWDAAKGCVPIPGVVVRFKKDGEVVDLHFCFECQMLSIAPPGSLRWEDFDPVHAQLAALMKEVFPSDPTIQGL